MTKVDQWPIEVTLHQEDRETRAEAHLTRNNGIKVSGHGLARRNPDDRRVTEIGEEIAAARALSDLAHKLLSTAADEIETVTHEQARLHM
jgi:Rv2632c-like